MQGQAGRGAARQGGTAHARVVREGEGQSRAVQVEARQGEGAQSRAGRGKAGVGQQNAGQSEEG